MRKNYPRAAADGRLKAFGRRWQRGLAGLAGLLLTFGVQAQQRPTPIFFADDAQARQAASVSPLAAALQSSRSVTLDEPSMRAALATAPGEKQAGPQSLILVLPLPDGTDSRFQVVESSIMAPELAAKFPSIKTYAGVGLDDPAASLRLDLTPQGFHAQVLSAKTGDFFIDPTTRTDKQHYLSFWRRDMPGHPFDCGIKVNDPAPAKQKSASSALRTSAPTLRTYRLAVAATGEYTAFQGGTVERGQAAIVTTVNRVVGVYEKELDVRFVLVANNSALVYTDGTTDPYTNGTPSSLLTQNQANIDLVIGTANYDIGHVFSTAGGGLAGLGVVCSATRKAQGETGTSSPVGDAFDIDYVAHEMGHQCGANHTFNSVTSSCGGGNRSAANAYEVGSGTTIMAYAGICGADNIQSNSNAYFHVSSYEAILTYLTSATCGTTSSTGNTAPVVGTLPATKVLPIGTPFRLTASGTDAEGDALSYCWEEYDLGPGGAALAAQVANTTPPLFRSFDPTTSPTRYFPRLSDIIGNTATLGERLPTVTRGLNFRVTLRDQHNGTQGVVGGINSSDVVALSTTSAAGPFLVTAPNAAITWASGSTQTINWDVAGTTANGVNCATVNVRLSTDGGLTYPTVLLTGTANDGAEPVTLPSITTTTARIMVEAADNYFFDISNTNFSIVPATACPTPTNLAVSAITGTTATVSFTPSGTATSYTVSTFPATTTQTVTTSPVSLTGLTPGVTYTVRIVSTCGGNTTSTDATVTFMTTPPPPCNAPTNLAVSSITSTTASLTFTPSSTAPSYTVTTTPATTTQTVTASPVSLTGLTAGTNYTVTITSLCTSGSTATTTTTFSTLPLNDECAAAVTLTSGTTCVTTTGTVTGATQTRVASTCSGYASATANDVWYSFVATGTTHTVRLTTTTLDGVLEVLSGTCSSLTSLSCSDNVAAGTETVTLTTLTPNTRYYIRVYPYTEATTDVVTGNFTICVTNPAPVCAAPTALVVSSITGTTASVSFTPNTLAPSYTVTTTPATTTQTVTTSPVSLTGLTPSTNYTVNIVSLCSNGLSSTAATATFTTSVALATKTGSQANPLSVFPNPARTSASVSGAKAGATIEVFDATGRRVATAAAATDGTAHLTLSGLAAGFYVVRSGAQAQKLAVE